MFLANCKKLVKLVIGPEDQKTLREHHLSVS